MPGAKRVLLLATSTGYQSQMFRDACARLGVAVQIATDRCHRLDDPWGDQAVPVRFDNPEEAVRTLSAMQSAPDGIVAIGDPPTEVAAAVAAELRLPYHPAHAVEACRDKHIARQRFAAAGLLVPQYYRLPLTIPGAEAARNAPYPCVLKPLGLSGSRGVIRANDEGEFADAFERIACLLDRPELRQHRRDQDHFLQVEAFVPGREFALEGLVTGGRLQTLAIFDKPDALDGPYFEETIYTTPSREASETQRAIIETTQRAVTALGLTHGPIHAEMRCNSEGVWMLEVAARPIGGLCAQTLRFQNGITLEEVIVRHAIGEDTSPYTREAQAAGVMMIPIPSNGIYAGFEGEEEASAVRGIENLMITAAKGQRLERLPEGNSYLGFLFARGETAGEVERALRLSHAKLRFEIATELPTVQPLSTSG